jgi:hypothetical protein
MRNSGRARALGAVDTLPEKGYNEATVNNHAFYGL